MSLPTVELTDRISRADERALAVSALACLDRCLPLLEYEAGVAVDSDAALRPLWEAAEGGEEWLSRLRQAAALVVRAVTQTESAPVAVLRRAAAVPRVYAADELRIWAGECSAAALAVHRYLDGDRDDGPLATGELRRQERLLGLLAGDGDGLRAAFVQSTEGKRVLRAAAARRARRA
ncbi:hypothetical protein GCM10010329_04690 [Streptomyces spiroverticillatus]|uniref:Uncharacterized protein n=1 Tax=Streptomyces finlayi TaxID=67296 RepID=A0A918WT95_9ACTN|nr:hypothetical protein [Streptomyces finlayi]GGZ87746.1 hypothetical protein GCM10010329_04690 [Streptomyces spiroverticillatus]GHC78911.1 hypothetical protein GCM10010334_04670 [Streptomyces finlayi]